MGEILCESLQHFIRAHIRSVGHLEVLLLLTHDPHLAWGAESVSRELRTNLKLAESQLRELHGTGLLRPAGASPGLYQLTAEPSLMAMIRNLEAAYRLKRTTVITFIYSRPLESMLSFADAFKI